MQMETKPKKTEQSLEEYLQNLRTSSGSDIVVSLLISDNRIDFISCQNKNSEALLSLDDDEEEVSSDGTPELVAECLSANGNYIG